MLIIRPNQFEEFNTRARAQFLDEVTLLLHKASGTPTDSTHPTAEDRQTVEILAQKAESFGLRSHSSIGIFLQVAFHIGADFYDVFRPVGEVLRSPLLNENTKRYWLEKWYFSLIDTKEITAP